MSKKSIAIAVVLGIFGFGGFYAAGLKKGLLLFVAISVLGLLISNFVSPGLAIIATLASVYVSYKWASEHNAALALGKEQA
nr:phospho-N-acetylmuramoyl-pentapeptide-transferase [uncultured Anaeromusa sp.]